MLTRLKNSFIGFGPGGAAASGELVGSCQPNAGNERHWRCQALRCQEGYGIFDIFVDGKVNLMPNPTTKSPELP